MGAVFEREALFREVWANPISTLAKKYGMSDNGLRKICKSLGVPLPARGHWAKVAAGHHPATPQLPQHDRQATYASRGAPLVSAAARAIDPWLVKCCAFEKQPENAISVQPELVRPHRLVAQTVRDLVKVRAALEKSKARLFNPPSRPVGEPPTLNSGPHWRDYARRGHLPELSPGALPLRVSIEAADRALRIWDALIKASVRRKLSVSVANNRLELGVDGGQSSVRMTEKRTKSTDRHSKATVANVPTGILQLVVGAGVYEKRFSDKPDKPLEQQLNNVLLEVFQRIQKSKESELHQENTRLSAEAVRVELAAVEKAAAQERQRTDLLVAEAITWNQAQQVRAYVTHLQALTAAVPEDDDRQRWLAWATAAADRLDPSKRRLGH